MLALRLAYPGHVFELAVAIAIVRYELHSGAALTTMVGVLIELPVMLMLVKIVNGSKAWYERAGRRTVS